MTRPARLAALLALALVSRPDVAAAQPRRVPERTPVTAETARPQMFTTYFYTAGEAVIQSYENGTNVRIFTLESRTPIYSGRLDDGESVLVPTGAGVFGFVSDRKAAILVGTPSSCTAVGYWARDPDGRFVADRLLVQLPSNTTSADDRAIVWASEATHVVVRDRTSNQLVFEGDLEAQGRFMLEHDRLTELGSHVLEVRASRPVVSVQVYYDEGFTVPSTNGRTSGREFYTYVGRTTNGENDVVLTSYSGTAHVRVEDMTTHETLFDGGVEAGHAHPLTMHQRFVKITADRDIGAAVVPYVHYVGPYAEHHFAGGNEGVGVDTDFLVTTPRDLWLFSYFNANHVRVEDATTHRLVWEGDLSAGGSTGLSPGQGFYRVRTSGGASVMGGAESCGGEYSPAGRLFAVDEAVMRAVERVHQQRVEAAAARGVALSREQAAAAPLSAAEVQAVTSDVQRATGSRVYGAAAVQERMDAMARPAP